MNELLAVNLAVPTTPLINYWAVLAAMVSSMVVGFVFYHRKVLGTRWTAAAGHTEESVESGPVWIYPAVMAASFVTAWILAGADYLSYLFYGGSFLWNVLLTGWILWFGLTALRFFVHDLFGPSRGKHTWLAALNEFATVTVMCLIIGIWPPEGLDALDVTWFAYMPS
ncbi:DUF1761 domain-containing protein [Galactobacter valiniphilus]|uniref:DUF1761 domain-containing protein n=1 Tax=Galactobacter valiniphilus TaxID=2676122 RepID=UPI00373595BE